jgi:hypothetical protein
MWSKDAKLKINTCINKKANAQQAFGKIANFVVNTRLFLARILSLIENNRFRSSQPRQAPERCKRFFPRTKEIPILKFKNKN